MPNPTPTITRLRSDEPVAKAFTVDPATGELTARPQGTVTNAAGEVLDTPSAGALAALIERLDPCDVLMTGQPRNGARTVTVKTDKRVRGMGKDTVTSRGIVARTLDYFEFETGPGWLLIDHDTKAMPEDVRARVEALGGGLGALAHIWPDVLKAARVFKPSSSGGVYVEGGSRRVATGFHLFVLVEDVSRSAMALAALQARAWAAGLAFFRLSAAGGRLERSIVDTAVGSPERLIFTAPPILGPGVFRDPPPLRFWEGEAVAIPSAPPPETWEPIRDAARAALEPEAVRVTATTRGISEPEAREIVRAGGTRESLPGDVLIYGPGGGLVRVRDLVAGLSRPCRLSLPDPFEGPSYGRTTASLIWDKGNAAPIIVSHAHGVRTLYRLPPPEYGKTPAQAIWDVRPPDLPDRRAGALGAALAGVLGVSQIGTVLAVAAALANRTPAQMEREDVVRFLREHLKPGAIPADWIAAVMTRIDWTQDKRRERALAPVRISAKARAGVEVMTVRELGELDRVEGITVLKAPMAAGKTQLVAHPWTAAAKRAAARDRRIASRDGIAGEGKELGQSGVWAVCHRVALVAELAHRLDLESYRGPGANGSATAICLPSITLDPFARCRPGFLFIDEIQQTLRFLRSEECCRTAKARTPDLVFNRLVEVVRGARGILVADAGADDSVLDFLRFCRPGDPIRLIEMPEPKDAGIAAEILTGEKGVYGAAVDQAAADLHRGEKVWIATEGAEAAERVGVFLRDATANADRAVRVLVLTARNKGELEQERFLKDPEAESRRWDCVIASPVIASGISIEHKGAPHFTRGFYLGTGQALTPADAAQQLRRVRYLRRFVIALAQNNSTGGRTVESILKGRSEAAKDEGVVTIPGAFDHLIARFEAAEADSKADFAAGLWWILEASGWTLTRGTVAAGEAADALRQIAEDRAEDRARRLVEASRDLVKFSQDQIDTLRRTAATGADADLVEAWDLTRALGIAELKPEDVAFADGGGIVRLDRFDDLAGISPGDMSDRDRDAALVHRRLRIARAKHFAEIFAGVDPLSPDPWLTRTVADRILDRILDRADAFAASGAIPEKYAARFGRPTPARPRDPVKAVQAILARAGLGTVGIRPRGPGPVQMPPDCVTESAPIRTVSPSQRPAQGARERVYAPRPEDVAEMQRRSAIRRASRENTSHPAHIEAVKRLRSRNKHTPTPLGFLPEGATVTETLAKLRKDFSRLKEHPPQWLVSARTDQATHPPP